MHSSRNHAPRADTTCEGGQSGACEGGVGIMMESRLHACRGASFSLLLDPDVGDRGREELLGATQPKTCNVSPASAQHRGLGTHFWGRGSSIRIGTFGRWPLREGCRPRQSATDTFRSTLETCDRTRHRQHSPQHSPSLGQKGQKSGQNGLLRPSELKEEEK